MPFSVWVRAVYDPMDGKTFPRDITEDAVLLDFDERAELREFMEALPIVVGSEMEVIWIDEPIEREE